MSRGRKYYLENERVLSRLTDQYRVMLDARVKAYREERENMVVRRPAAKKVATPSAARKRVAAAAPAKKVAPPAKAGRDLSRYASADAITAYHKAMAKWIVTEIGYDPNTAPSLRAAFLRGVAIATVARPAFQDSEFLEEWRNENGVNKRGPKSAATEAAAPAPTKRRRAAEPEPAPVEEFEEEDAEEEDFEDDTDAEDFEDEDAESDDDEEFEDEDEDDAEEEEEEEFEEEEPAPAPRKRGRPAAAKSAPAPAKAAPAKRAPAKKTAAAPTKRTRPAAKPVDDEDFAF